MTQTRQTRRDIHRRATDETFQRNTAEPLGGRGEHIKKCIATTKKQGESPNLSIKIEPGRGTTCTTPSRHTCPNDIDHALTPRHPGIIRAPAVPYQGVQRCAQTTTKKDCP